MNILICPNCKKEIEHAHKQAICLDCGNIAVMPPLTDDAFEKIDETYVKEKNEKTKKAGVATFGSNPGGSK